PHFQNLIHLFEFYIPIVLYISKTLRSKEFKIHLKSFCLITFICIALDSRSYTYSCLIQLLQIRHWFSIDHPMRTILEKCPDKFLEVLMEYTIRFVDCD